MTASLTIVSFSIMALILIGLFLELFPEKSRQLVTNKKIAQRLKSSVGLNIIVFFGAIIAVMVIGSEQVMAAEDTVMQNKEISVGLGLALLGIGLPTGLATIGAGIAVGSVGSASLAVITEKPEMFGRTLIYLGLAEGIAIYGLVMSILLLGKL
ncbi:MAG: ATP synthase subunit C [Gammaproteobacteria bacterium]|jgi:V/A-type H+/Na+-transporting ATPase subunit K